MATTPAHTTLRDYATDERPALLHCIGELQDTRHALESRLPPGARIAQTHLDEIEASRPD